MNKTACILILVVLSACAANKWPSKKILVKKNYQEVVVPISDPDKVPDQFAMYSNGIDGILAHIMENVTYPIEAREKGISGIVVVSYVVGKDGYVGHIEMVKGIDPLLDREAIRLITLMDRWIPGKKDGNPVSIRYNQPIKFRFE